MHLDSIEVLGCRGEVSSVGDTLDKINDIRKDGEIIQMLDADAVAGLSHIVHGVNQAFLAFSRGENLAKDLSVEIVLRCSAQRQISRAFDILGLKEGFCNLCVVLINCDGNHADELAELFTLDDSVLEADENYLMEIYDIKNSEISVDDLIIDKITKLIVDY